MDNWEDTYSTILTWILVDRGGSLGVSEIWVEGVGNRPDSVQAKRQAYIKPKNNFLLQTDRFFYFFGKN